MCHVWCVCVFFKQKTAYYMRISDWSSDVCSSDLGYHRAGGVPAVIGELIRAGKINTEAMTVAGKTMGELHSGSVASDRRVIRPYDDPLMAEAGFIVLSGNLFDAAIMKTSVISPAFRERYLCRPGHRSEEHTSEPQSLMRISYSVFCLKKKKRQKN